MCLLYIFSLLWYIIVGILHFNACKWGFDNAFFNSQKTYNLYAENNPQEFTQGLQDLLELYWGGFGVLEGGCTI